MVALQKLACTFNTSQTFNPRAMGQSTAKGTETLTADYAIIVASTPTTNRSTT